MTSPLKPSLILIVAGLVTLGAAVAAAGLGAVQIGPLQILSMAGNHLGLPTLAEYSEQQALVFQVIRLPRLIFGLLSGAVLAACGAVLQGLFRNPLAEPSLLGMSSSASLFVAVTIVFGGTLKTALGLWALPLAAFVGSLVAGSFVYLYSLRLGTINLTTLLLSGLGINALAGSGVGLMIFLSRETELRDITFWSLGSLAGITWDTLLPALPFLLGTLLITPWLARALNVLLLGERDAKALGISVEAVKIIGIVLTALGVGAVTALAGIIGFVGLIGPHLARLIAGPDHRLQLPLAVCMGATIVVVADTVSRTVAIPSELPIGTVTAILGAPFFLWLIARQQSSAGSRA